MSKFNVNYRIGLHSLYPDYSMNLAGLMAYVQESSLLHTYTTPKAMGFYEERGWAWVLTHWQVEVYHHPRVNDNVTIYTWPVRYRGYFGERGFEVQDGGGRSMLIANSNWVLLNRETLAPVRPNDEIAEKFGAMHPFLIDKDFTMPKMTTATLISQNKYIPTRRDIDNNSHVNNAKYLEWVYGYLPDDIYNNYRAHSMKAVYKKEVFRGEPVDILLYKQGEGDNIEVFAHVMKNGQVATEVHLSFLPLMGRCKGSITKLSPILSPLQRRMSILTRFTSSAALRGGMQGL